MNDAIIIPKKTLKWGLIGLFLLFVLVLAFHFFSGTESKPPPAESVSSQKSATVSMGQKTGSAMNSDTKGASMSMPHEQGRSPVRYTMSPEAQMLAQVQTAEVKRQRAVKHLRMVGMVFEAEPRLATLTARIAGRLDAVFIDFTGVRVNKGDPMVTIWSPTLITSEVELFTSLQSPDKDLDTKGIIRGAEEKLLQYGMTKEQIKKIRETGKPDEYITLKAPVSGIVMKKNAIVGQFVNEGTEMFVINDLSHVWVKLDAYEPDLPWIRYGQEVTFTTPSFPGKIYKGKVIFIDPVLDMATRTVKVRVDVANPDYELKPHMFVNGDLEAEVDDHGRVIKPEWVGKYICPFDPTEVSDVPGICPKTKQPLKPATAYGYSGVTNPVLPLVIPETAVLFTGKRSIVYVEVPDQPQPTYEQRDVTLGPEAGNYYVVSDGLKEGEKVVVKGNFQIDSSLQILGEPSMMNPVESQAPPTGGMPSSHTTPKKNEPHQAASEKGMKAMPNMPANTTPGSHSSSEKDGK